MIYFLIPFNLFLYIFLVNFYLFILFFQLWQLWATTHWLCHRVCLSESYVYFRFLHFVLFSISNQYLDINKAYDEKFCLRFIQKLPEIWNNRCIRENLKLIHGDKNTGILPIKIPLNRSYWNHYLDSRCTVTVMMPEMMPQALCCTNIILNK